MKGPMGGRGHGNELLPMRLLIPPGSLTPDQEQQVHAIMQSNHDAAKQLHQQIETARHDLGTKFLTPGPLDAAALAPQLQQIAQLRQQLQQQKLNTALAVRKLLSADQLAAAAARRDKLQALHSEMRKTLGGEK